MAVELFQFAASHFNEKARWVLDYKRIPHVRHTLLPGPHRLTAMRISGQPLVPLLRYDGKVVAGSSAIIDALEGAHPTPPLYPSDPQQRARALEIQQWFDDEIGPEVRRAKFSDILDDAPYVAHIFSRSKSWPSRALYRAAFPGLRIVMRRDMRITPDTAAEARNRTRAGLDFVVKEAGPNGYLVGDSFSVADLAAAALLAVTTWLPGTTMAPPEPHAAVEERWMARWADHPGIKWVERTYARHRGTSCETPRA